MHFRTLALSLALGLSVSPAAAAVQKTVITSADQLPRRSYQLTGTVAELLEDDAQLTRLAKELKANLLADLEKLDIQDKATLAGYHASLAILHAFLDEPAKALAQIPVMRDLETKPATRLTTGLFLESWARTKLQAPDESSPRFKELFERTLAAAYAPLSYADIREHVESNRSQTAMISAELVLGSAQTLQTVLDNTGGTVPEGVVFGLIGIRFALDHRIPLKEQMLRVYTSVSDANDVPVVKNDIWSEREVVLSPSQPLTPVVIAIWDSSVDPTALPEANLYVNSREVADGRDNDDNGYVDDVHGIGYETDGTKAVGTLESPAGRITSDIPRLQRLTKGGLDLQAGIRSAEAAELQATVGSLKRDEVTPLMEELSFYTGYMHGTHVAGIALAGNPAARILAARMSHNYQQMPEPYTMEKAKARARMFKDTVEYFKRHGVKVVNMSWRYNSAAIEGSLAVNGVGKDEADRRRMAREMFEVEEKALFEAIKGAPGILFVCGSGNENNDANFSQYIPASFELPNLITVGAVDIEGRKTSFTTEGRSVDFFANGHEVESYVPGGARMRISGTSMASPQAANLAAKLLALDPALTPEQIVALIQEGSEPSAEDPSIRLINPKKTLARLGSRH